MSEKIMKGKDLKKVAPRSPHVKVGDFLILGRTIDKCRALLWGNIGEYHFDCPLDNQLFGFKGIKGDDFKKFVETGATDEEIANWVNTNGLPKTKEEIETWNKEVESNNYSKLPEKKAWLEGENTRLGLDKDGTLFDYLDADDKDSTGPKVC
jgi:hypothetical protein